MKKLLILQVKTTKYLTLYYIFPNNSFFMLNYLSDWIHRIIWFNHFDWRLDSYSRFGLKWCKKLDLPKARFHKWPFYVMLAGFDTFKIKLFRIGIFCPFAKKHLDALKNGAT